LSLDVGGVVHPLDKGGGHAALKELLRGLGKDETLTGRLPASLAPLLESHQELALEEAADAGANHAALVYTMTHRLSPHTERAAQFGMEKPLDHSFEDPLLAFGDGGVLPPFEHRGQELACGRGWG